MSVIGMLQQLHAVRDAPRVFRRLSSHPQTGLVCLFRLRSEVKHEYPFASSLKATTRRCPNNRFLVGEMGDVVLIASTVWLYDCVSFSIVVKQDIVIAIPRASRNVGNRIIAPS